MDQQGGGGSPRGAFPNFCHWTDRSIEFRICMKFEAVMPYCRSITSIDRRILESKAKGYWLGKLSRIVVGT